MVEQPQEVIEGLKIVLSLFDNAKGVIAVENNKPDVIENLKKLTENEDRIQVAELKNKISTGIRKTYYLCCNKKKINSFNAAGRWWLYS